MHYARMQDGRVVEVIAPQFDDQGAEIPVSERFHPDFVAELVEYDPANPPAVVPVAPVVPASVTRFQARAALYNAGHFEDVEAFMAGPNTPMLMRLAWQDAQTFDRDSDTVAALASVLQLDDAAIDALFLAAAEIRG